MQPENWKKIKALFNEVVDLAPEQRHARLNAASEQDTEIFDEVSRLLAAEGDGLFDKPAADLTNIWQTDTRDEYTGKEIGGYKITREIGHGGMGIVFEAVREKDDFSQTVALKLLKRGMDSAAMLRRFSHERQILASLEHPNIARLLDGGMSDEGTPFFAMEYVSGESVDVYCAEKDLGINERLRLFLQIASAVSFAHSRLVVHRDLKPNNILVTGNGTVKLLDFGIARIISPDDDGVSHTVTSLGMMTPAYASPEQVSGRLVSTASDIYSLGLVLYQMLTGEMAYSLPNGRPDEIARIICEVDPPRPSSVVSTASVTADKNATANGKQTTNPRSRLQNQRLLRGDLDTIILKALRKEPERRYASVEQFALDIRRHLDGLTVIARPDTFSYRFEKFVARHRVSVIAGVLVLLTLVGGIAATTSQMVRAERQRSISDQRFDQVRALANNIVFRYYDEAEKLPNSTKLREMMVTDALNYFDSLAADHNTDDTLKSELALAYIRIGKVMGRAYFANLGDVNGAIANYQKGIALLEPLAAKSVETKLKVDLINAYSELATALRRQGSIQESDALLQKAIGFNEDLQRANPGDILISLRLVTLYLYQGDSLPVGNGAGENITAYKHSVDVCEEILKREPNHVRTNNILAAAADRIATNLTILARDATADGDNELAGQLHQDALRMGERNLQITKKIVELQPDEVLNIALNNATIFNYGTYEFEAGDYAQGLADQRKAERGFRDEYENDKSNLENKLLLSSVLSAISATHMRLAHRAESEKVYDEAINILDELIASDAANFDYRQKRWEAKFTFADELLLSGDAARARPIYESAAAEIDKIAHEKDPGYGESLKGFYLDRMGNCDRALARAAGVTPAKQRELTENALISYRQALDLWRQYGAQSILGITQPGKIEVLEHKIARGV